MPQTLAHISLLVRDYDEAISYFTTAPGSDGASLLLAKASTSEQVGHIGSQTGGRVFLFLHTDDFWRDYHAMKARNVKFIETPREEKYGTVAVFEDLYGNKWDLLQPKAEH